MRQIFQHLKQVRPQTFHSSSSKRYVYNMSVLRLTAVYFVTALAQPQNLDRVCLKLTDVGATACKNPQRGIHSSHNKTVEV